MMRESEESQGDNERKKRKGREFHTITIYMHPDTTSRQGGEAHPQCVRDILFSVIFLSDFLFCFFLLTCNATF
jgi:hypothetical protein